MNKFGLLSLLMVAINVALFFILRGPNANLTLGVILFGSLSIIGVIFAIMSRKAWSITAGLILNGCVIVFALLLWTAMGISEP
ncbi:hypothetical protein [Siminovitchia fortis]|uniref:NADH dehydrogenase subunit 6 n=1 Tax=Siminovitchia fortis TaxID=254758 RepID=A0A443IYM1_9BACI|nr:hypothetical protein [Siminovitchia fortis]RWR13217.1 hypothetical protein D4N35_005460 [Siminovitchia fortis]WHY82002.1 hypothetical protein QNH23_00785 [Siminovitchia fortis]